MSAPCGTPGGYRRHRKRGEGACGECRQANAEYMSQLREKNPQIRSTDAAQTRARSRALARLAKENPSRYQALLIDELARDVAKEATPQ